MPDFRTVHIDVTESTLEIYGSLRLVTFEKYGDDKATETIELSLYRPVPYLEDHQWLKDVLVQVIEQL